MSNTPKPDDTPKRKSGRPTIDGGTGGFQRVQVSLYPQHLAIARQITPQVSASIRVALEFYAAHHTPALGADVCITAPAAHARPQYPKSC